jgi:hypothetical protein
MCRSAGALPPDAAPPPDVSDTIYDGFNDFDEHDSGPSASPPNVTGQQAAGSRYAQSPPANAGAAAGDGAPIPVQPVQGALCGALAPEDWMIVDQDAQGTTATFSSGDQRMKAAYGVMAINGGAAQGWYGPQAQTPANLAQCIASLVAGEQHRDAHRHRVVVARGRDLEKLQPGRSD